MNWQVSDIYIYFRKKTQSIKKLKGGKTGKKRKSETRERKFEIN